MHAFGLEFPVGTVAGTMIVRRFLISIIDLALVAASVAVALFVRDEFAWSPQRLAPYGPYMAMSVACAAMVLPAMGMSRRMWRFSTLTDYTRIATACLIIVCLSVTAGYLTQRMEGVARSIPVLQLMFMASAMIGARLAARTLRGYRDSAKTDSGPLAAETVLVLCAGPLAQGYLRALPEVGGRTMRIVGLVTERHSHVGRVIFGYQVLGAAAEIERVIDDLTVHAVHIDRVVVTAGPDGLSSEVAGIMAGLEQRRAVRVEWLGAALPLAPVVPLADAGTEPPHTEAAAFVVPAQELLALTNRRYWSLKRGVDVVGAVVLLGLMAPVIAAVWLLVTLEFGQPVMFWQMRPGKGGRPFRLYKFRSMASPRDAQGRRRPDAERMTSVGWFLRRSRLDELPQLVNILLGDMSFVGPRPLIQAEQSAAYAARLMVRPGLTGWAQVRGGRDISVADKAALDIWYVRNASLARDFEIALRTVPMVLFGESVHVEAIRSAWRELELAGISKRPAGAGEGSATAKRLAA
jgi:lipopolysaccharide/colanic/teichoic acid biosynthesis glycosyltransferase